MPWSAAQYRFTLPATSEPTDERSLVIAQATDGGPDVAQVLPAGRSVRLQNARDLYLVLRELFEGEVHLSAGLGRVERRARERAATDRGLGRADTPEAMAAWDALAQTVRDRYLLVARRDLELQGLAGAAAADAATADVTGLRLGFAAQVEYRAVARWAARNGFSLGQAHQLWATTGDATKAPWIEAARIEAGQALRLQKAMELYAATGDQVHVPWDQLDEAAQADYLRRSADTLVHLELLDTEGRLVMPERGAEQGAEQEAVRGA